MNENTFEKFVHKTPLRFSATALVIITFVGLLFVSWTYLLSAQYVSEANISVPRNRRDDGYFFRPVLLTIGDRVSEKKIKEHLAELGYVDAVGGGPGTYQINGQTFEIRSIRPQVFPDVSITIKRERIASLLEKGSTVHRSALPPLQILGFSTFLDPMEPNENLPTRQIPVSSDGIPVPLMHAISSAEDRRYFETANTYAHHGCSPFNIFRRVVFSGGQEGGSGLGQQALKLRAFRGAGNEFWDQTFPFVSSDLRRKLVDCQMAMALEQEFGKDEVFAFYANSVPLGPSNGVDLVGVEASAREYFGKSINQLELYEAATIAALIRKPLAFLRYVRNDNRCSALENERKTCRDLTTRRNWVLDRMREDRSEVYTQQMIDEAKKQPVAFIFASENVQTRPVEMVSQNFVRFAAKNRPAKLIEASKKPGESITTTTLDPEMQRQAFELAQNAITNLQPKIDSVCRTQNLDCSTKLPDRKREQVKPQVAFVALDAETGEILAMVGGINTSINYATDVSRDPGSCHKPFYILKGIETGMWRGRPVTAATIFSPVTDLLSERCGRDNLGRRANVSESLARSYNFHVCAVSQAANLPTDFVGELTGSSPVRQLASAIGETGEGSLLNLAGAYTVFPNNGRFISPTPFRAIHKDGVKVELPLIESKQIADPGAAWIVGNMLQSVTGPNGTAPRFRRQAELTENNYSIGAKSGTGQTSDLTFVAFTPKIIVAARISMPDNKPELKVKDGFTGSSIAGPIVADFFKFLKQRRPEYLAGEFIRPPTVVERRIDRKRGCSTDSGSEVEFFMAGREPSACNDLTDERGLR